MMKGDEKQQGFRHHLDVDSTSSTYSDSSDQSTLHKKLIDSLFNDKRMMQRKSESSDNSSTKYTKNDNVDVNHRKPLMQQYDDDDHNVILDRSNHFQDVKSAVHAQIEKMFLQSLPADHQKPISVPKESTNKSPAAVKEAEQRKTTRTNISEFESLGNILKVTDSVKFKVTYLGAIVLEEKATRLEHLQIPLKRLYMQYRTQMRKGKMSPPGTLEITEIGVKVQYVRELDEGVQEMFNPFPTIAVWAAVKFVAKKQLKSGETELKFAFLPLICDPESKEKFILYNDLEKSYYNEAFGSRSHPPVFACVMRKPGLMKTLECHGFICNSAEDAIVIAANLYQSLLSNMKTDSSTSKTTDEISDVTPQRPPRRKKPMTSSLVQKSKSIDSINVVDKSSSSSSRRYIQHKSNSNGSGNSRRKPSHRLSNNKMKRNSIGSTTEQSSSCSNKSSSDMTHENTLSTCSDSTSRRLTRSVSDRYGTFVTPATTEEKNSLARSKSFVELSSHRMDIKQFLAQIQAKDGIRTVDDVLKQVINPGGMSFSELRPEHRELLLRLALTLSKDEMYERSKLIMRKQNKTRCFDSDTDGSTISNVLKATKKTISRFSSRAGSFRSPSYYLKEQMPLGKFYGGKSSKNYNSKGTPKIITSSSTDNCFRNGETNLKLAPVRKPSPYHHLSDKPLHHHQKPPSRSAIKDSYCFKCNIEYASCNMNCYCSSSNSHAKTTPTTTANRYRKRVESPTITLCECDSESCAESDKCYCSLIRPPPANILTSRSRHRGVDDYNSNSLRALHARRGYVSVDNLSRIDSPNTAWTKNTLLMGQSRFASIDSSTNETRRAMHLGLMKNRSSGSLFEPQFDLSPNNSSSSRKADVRQRRYSSRRKSASVETLQHELTNHRNNSSSGSTMSEKSNRTSRSAGSGKKFLLVSAADPSGKIVYRSASHSLGKKSNSKNDADNNILSMKKTAEIAALFSELKLNQTTDLLADEEEETFEDENKRKRDTNEKIQFMHPSHLYSEQNIENTLGYLP